MPIEPIKPSEVQAKRTSSIPDFVIEAFNELIAEKVNNSGYATVKQCDAIDRILSKAPQGVNRDKIFKDGYLDVENYYIQAGWKVVYDKPGYNETYEATFQFSSKRARVKNLSADDE